MLGRLLDKSIVFGGSHGLLLLGFASTLEAKALAAWLCRSNLDELMGAGAAMPVMLGLENFGTNGFATADSSRAPWTTSAP